MSASDWTTILSAVVGSHAYGLNHEESDVDRMAFGVAPTEQFHGLMPPTGSAATRVTTAPDSTTHEIGKACSLLLKCNPSVTEMLWMPEYEVITPFGELLVAIRQKFLSKRGVRNAYLGYATAQFKRLVNREDGTFSSDTRLRTAKHARHIWRLLWQAQELHTFATLTVRLNPDRVAQCRAFGETVATDREEGLELAGRMLKVTEVMMDTTDGRLPEHADTAEVELYLRQVRLHWLKSADDVPR